MQVQEIRRRRRGQAGFTLVELMVVIAIIAILASIVGFNVLGAIGEGNISATKAQISNLKTALIAYKLQFKKFPQSLDELVNNPKRNFLDSKEVPTDAWGNPFVYKLEGANGFVIVSYGGDGTPGGEGENGDISSDNLGEE